MSLFVSPGRWSFVFLGLLLLAGCGEKLPPERRPDMSTVEQIRQGLSAEEAQAGAEESAEVPSDTSVTQWGTVTGQFVFEGTVPTAAPVNVTAEL